jgi:hypothetical protein
MADSKTLVEIVEKAIAQLSQISFGKKAWVKRAGDGECVRL